MASLGRLSAAPVVFENAVDLDKGGVLCAVPALLALGLLSHSKKHFDLPPGYYPMESILLCVAFLALARVQSMEALRYEAPGEWGRLMGLDRVPEVRTLREKIGQLCGNEAKVREWSSGLAREWMELKDDGAGTLYVDGHVRVYNGELTKLPARYVARQKLCLRGTTDYWVNAMDGAPFFAVSQSADPGLIQTLESKILPQLLKDVPRQPSEAELAADPRRERFTLIFDRAGYSPAAFKRLWKDRVAVITYHKNPGELWDENEFSLQKTTLANGETVEISLAERGVELLPEFWVREVRQREPGGHQVAIVSTDFRRDLTKIAAALFARWCQENFFQYMKKHYGLDRLIEYGTAPLPETTRVVNPTWRKLDQTVRREASKLKALQAKLGSQTLSIRGNEDAVGRFECETGQILLEIQAKEEEVKTAKALRKETKHHVLWKDLPEEDRFHQLLPTKKHFIDTIRIIAYRAETSLACIVREKLARNDDARSLVRQILRNSVDLRPDESAQTLTVHLHALSSSIHNMALAHLCAELNSTETLFPGTSLRLVFELDGSLIFPRDQES